MQYTIKRSQAASEQVADIVRSMLIEGYIKDGQRINEVRLSEKLNVSRTPLREGLGQLVAEDFVEMIPRRGFFARELSSAEFSDLYDMRPILDPHALSIAGLPSPQEIDKIEAANHKFLNAKSGIAAVKADEVFHRLLIQRCPNLVLLGLIENLMKRTLRYELALFRETSPIQFAGNQHALIIEALRREDMDAAAQCLRDNLTSGKGPILTWLENRPNQTD